MNDSPNRDPEVVGTITLDNKTQRFYQGAAVADEVLEAHAGTAFPTQESRVALFWFYVGVLAVEKYQCSTSEDLDHIVLGATTRAPIMSEPRENLPEFEYAVEYDDLPVGLFFERAEQQLTVGGGAPPTVTDVKRLAEKLRDQGARVVGIHLLCPTCQTTDNIVLVDISHRWNRLSVSDVSDMLGVSVGANVHEGNGDYEDDHYLCTARTSTGYCHTKLEAPEGFDVSWG